MLGNTVNMKYDYEAQQSSYTSTRRLGSVTFTAHSDVKDSLRVMCKNMHYFV